MEPSRRVILDAEAYVYVDLGEATAYNIAEAMHTKGTPCKSAGGTFSSLLPFVSR